MSYLVSVIMKWAVMSALPRVYPGIVAYFLPYTEKLACW